MLELPIYLLDDPQFRLIILFWAAIGGAVGGMLGQSKNKQAYGIALGVIFGPLGWLLVLASPGLPSADDKISRPTSPTQTTDDKLCPFCAETIRGKAVVCRFCNSKLEAQPAQPSATSEAGSLKIPLGSGRESSSEAATKTTSTLPTGETAKCLSCGGIVEKKADKCWRCNEPVVESSPANATSDRVAGGHPPVGKPEPRPPGGFQVPVAIALLVCLFGFIAAGVIRSESANSQAFSREAKSLLDTYEKVVFFFEPAAAEAGPRSYSVTAANLTHEFLGHFNKIPTADPRGHFVTNVVLLSNSLDLARTKKDNEKCKKQLADLRKELGKL